MNIEHDNLSEAYFIAQITGQNIENKAFWAYLAIPFDKYDAYRLAEQGGEFDLEDYGVVLAYGLGDAPSDEEKNAMRQKYKLDDDFENKLSMISDLIGEDIL